MYRGSSFLLQKSVKHLENTIKYIAERKEKEKDVWDIDVDKYDAANIQKIIDIYEGIKEKLKIEDHADLTLTTKVLLGVFGFIPAFDSYFCDTFRKIAKNQCGFREVNKKSLEFIKDFYEANKSDIDELSKDTFTKSFETGEKTEINYPKAKIIDMYGFQLGLKKKYKFHESINLDGAITKAIDDFIKRYTLRPKIFKANKHICSQINSLTDLEPEVDDKLNDKEFMLQLW
jgi:hypothetical protein